MNPKLQQKILSQLGIPSDPPSNTSILSTQLSDITLEDLVGAGVEGYQLAEKELKEELRYLHAENEQLRQKLKPIPGIPKGWNLYVEESDTIIYLFVQGPSGSQCMLSAALYMQGSHGLTHEPTLTGTVLRELKIALNEPQQ